MSYAAWIVYCSVFLLLALLTGEWSVVILCLAFLVPPLIAAPFIYFYHKAEDQADADEGLTEELRRANSTVRKEEANGSDES